MPAVEPPNIVCSITARITGGANARNCSSIAGKLTLEMIAQVTTWKAPSNIAAAMRNPRCCEKSRRMMLVILVVAQKNVFEFGFRKYHVGDFVPSQSLQQRVEIAANTHNGVRPTLFA